MSIPTIRVCDCPTCQGFPAHPDKELHYQMNLFLSTLNEQQKRWYVALEAKKIGHGGAKLMHQITGMSMPTIRRGRQELDNGLLSRPSNRARLPGGGRPTVEKKRPEIIERLELLVVDEVAGDPMSERKYVRSSLRNLSDSLQKEGYQSSPKTVSRLLKDQDYSLQANRKCLSGPPHPDQDIQLKYIRRVKKLFLAAGHPVISIDCKKKELIGNFKNAGRVWCQKADKVNQYDFSYLGQGRAAPYGIYDILHNWGCVVVGTSADTAEFAVDAITLWWKLKERPTFLDESKLLILCDGGGSNGYRPRLWKLQLQTQLADQFGLEVMVCHYPTGASKYNPIERRLFSPISVNWAGTPLRSFEMVLGYIRDTSNKTGLSISAFLLDRKYKIGKKVSDAEMRALNLTRRRICPKWNYIIKPRQKGL